MSSQIPSTNAVAQKQHNAIHWPSVAQLGLSLLVILNLWGFALTLAMVGIISLFEGAGIDMPTNTTLVMTMAAGAFVAGILLLPSAGYALLRLSKRSTPTNFHLRRTRYLFLLVPPLLLLGYWISQNPGISWAILPPVHIAVTVLTILWLLGLGMRELSPGSPQRGWGVFNVGLIASPIFSFIVEIIILFGGSIAIFMVLFQDPVLLEEVTHLLDQISIEAQPPEAILQFLEPYLQKPVTIILALIFASVLVPLVEELFKSLGVWLIAGRKITPSQGFTAGMLNGAGFALFENFVNGGGGEAWSSIMVARIGTTVMHILTAGLTGWGIAQALNQRRYLRLVGAYLFAMGYHAIWNAAAIFLAASELTPLDTFPRSFQILSRIAPVSLMVLSICGLLFMIWFNKRLRRAIIPPAT